MLTGLFRSLHLSFFPRSFEFYFLFPLTLPLQALLEELMLGLQPLLMLPFRLHSSFELSKSPQGSEYFLFPSRWNPVYIDFSLFRGFQSPLYAALSSCSCPAEGPIIRRPRGLPLCSPRTAIGSLSLILLLLLLVCVSHSPPTRVSQPT